jgi:biofilm PGA synthesis N-glycosyltransferase PgaC
VQTARQKLLDRQTSIFGGTSRSSISAKMDRISISITAVFLSIGLGLAIAPSETVKPFVTWGLITYSLVLVARALFFITYAQRFEQQRTQSADQFDPKFSPLISILVPCYNEEDVVLATLKNLTQLNYPHYEILVLDDGSQDKTGEIVLNYIDEAGPFPAVPVKYHYKENSGKSDTLNYGVSQANGEFLLCVDGDSQLHPDTLSWGIRHFKDYKLGALAGFVEIINQQGFLAKLQQMEYLIGNFQKKAFSFFNMVPIIPGPIGLFRKKALEQVGGYESFNKTFAEDTELTLRLISQGWKLKVEDKMISYTECPETLSTLLRQRYRWGRGTYQAVSKNFHLLVNSGKTKNFALACYLFFEQVIMPIAEVSVLLFFTLSFLMQGKTMELTSWFVLLMGIELIITRLSLTGRKDKLKWYSISFASRWSYALGLTLWKALCLKEEWSSIKMAWDKLARTGTVTETQERKGA